jgi:hypothetical protein
MTHTEPMVETVDEDKDAENVATEVWESQWHDFGALPKFIPEFNVALGEFIVKQAETMESFPETLCQEGGIRSYEQFIKVFNSPNTKILQTLGGKVASTYEKEIIKCIVLAKFLNTT